MVSFMGCGTLVISLDVAESLDESPVVAGSLKLLLEAFRQHRLPATWASSDPAKAAWASEISVNDELAILVQGNLARDQRSESQRILRARAAGFEVTSMVLDAPATPAVYRVAEQLGVRTLRNSAGGRVSPSRGMKRLVRKLVSTREQPIRLPAVRTIAHGLVDVPATMRLGAISSVDAARIERSLEQACAEGKLIHLAIDVRELLDSLHASRRGLASLFGAIATRRAKGSLAAMTLAGAAARATRQRGAQRACSILRRQAA